MSKRGLIGTGIILVVVVVVALFVIPSGAKEGISAKLQKWEHTCKLIPAGAGLSEMTTQANDLGNNGWELVLFYQEKNTTGRIWCFKRPKK